MSRFAIVFLAACSIPNNQFRASPDGGGTDADPGVLAIVPSDTGITVDEGSTKDFTVQLNQAPSAPLTVSVSTTQTTKLGISVPDLTFTTENFAQPQTVTVTGLGDPDTVDAHADVKLSATGVEDVMVAATVHDLDTVQMITDVGGTNVVSIDEGDTATVHVHLSAQPTGDVAVSALVGTGPVVVGPTMLVFTPATYDVDQTFTLTAAIDPNTVSEDESFTLRADNVPDRDFTIHDVDHDVLNIAVSTTSVSVTEATGAVTVDVTLTQQPSSNVLVTVSKTTGHASIDKTQLTFTPANYAMAQHVTITAPDDADTHDDSDTIKLDATGLSERTVAVTIQDDDVQQILEDAPSPLGVTETTTASFNATLKFMPASTITVAVTSLDMNVAVPMTGTITFTPADYNMPHQVVVRGVHDNNLGTNTTSIRLFEASIGMTDVSVSVSDVDHQIIVLSTSALTVPEGMTGTFGVSLMFDPGTTVMVSLASTNPTALPLNRSSLTFTSANFATPQTVTVMPPIDSNNVGETATITASGGGAGSPATLTATVMDSTVVKPYGFPTPFTDTASVILGEVIAYKISTDATTTLDSFGVYIPAGTGDFRMALYADGLNAPGNLVAQMPVRQAITNGINTGNIPDVALPIGTYWIALRVAQTTAIGYSTVGTGPECIRNIDITNIDDPWPSVFGTATCSTDNFMNFFITTYHQ